MAVHCRHRKDKKDNANLVEKNKDEFSAVVSEVNLVTNVMDWWVDSGAIKHVCRNKDLFTSYQRVGEGEKLYMGNSSASELQEKERSA